MSNPDVHVCDTSLALSGSGPRRVEEIGWCLHDRDEWEGVSGTYWQRKCVQWMTGPQLCPSHPLDFLYHGEMRLWDLWLLIPDLWLSASRCHVSPHAGVALTCSQTRTAESPAGVRQEICSFDNTLEREGQSVSQTDRETSFIAWLSPRKIGF